MKARRPASLLACPKVSPLFELNAVLALMKPNERTKGKVEHVAGVQAWPAEGDGVLEAVRREVGERLGFRPEVHRPGEGEYWFAVPFEPAELEAAKALAVAASRRLPGLWLTLGRLLVRDGRFYRRQYGYKLKLVPATNVHLRREVREAIKGL
jgi:hypothetical protein